MEGVDPGPVHRATDEAAQRLELGLPGGQQAAGRDAPSASTWLSRAATSAAPYSPAARRAFAYHHPHRAPLPGDLVEQ